MAVRYDASSRRPGRQVDPLQAVDPWRNQAGDPGPQQSNLGASATTTDPWQSYVPLSAASTTFQAGAGQHGCFVTRTQPVPGGGSMAFSGTIPPGFQGAGSHGLPQPGAAIPPGAQGAGSQGLPHGAVPPGFQGAGPWYGGFPGGFPCGCGLQGGLQHGPCGVPVHGGALPMNGFGVYGGCPTNVHPCGMPYMPYGMPGPQQPGANQGGSPTFGGQSPPSSPQASQQQAGSTGPSQSGPAQSTSTTTPSSQPNVGTASEFVTNLNAGGTTATAHPAVTSAFEALGKTQPAVTQEDVTPDEAMKNLVMALGGERRGLPGWSGAPNMLRSWLKSLAFWERDNATPKSKWGVKLYQALSDDAKRIAETVPTEEILTENGYGKILTALLAKYKPYLEAVGPVSVDNYLFTGERQKGEAFTTYIARKEVQLQELESQIGATLHPLVSGRILLRQSYLTELQKDMISLRQNVLLTFDEVAKALRPLDRMEVLTKGQNASKGTATFFEAEKYQEEYGQEEGGEEDYGYEDEENDEENESMSSEPLEEGFLMFEDREYDEMEAIYVQAYNDVRRDLKQRRRERGFVRHGQGKGRGKGRGRKGSGGKGSGGKRPFRRDQDSRNKPRDDGHIKGSEQDLLARTKCWNCMEFGHYSRDCPLKKNPKKQFVMHTGGPSTSLAMVATSSSSTTRTIMASPDVPMNNQVPRPESLVRAIFAGIQCHGFECLVDTGAEDAVIGSNAAAALEQELQKYGLRVLTRKPPSIPACAGIGGSATLERMIDVPTCIAGLLGVIRFTVIKDTPGFLTPPLLPISYLEAVGARCNLDTNLYETRDGHTSPMRRLPSRHRVINMLDFDKQAWQLPDEHLVDGADPFLLTNPVARTGSSSPTSKASSRPSPTRSFLGGRPSRSRSRSPFASGFLRDLEGVAEAEMDTVVYASEIPTEQAELTNLKDTSYTPSIAPEVQADAIEDTPVGPQEHEESEDAVVVDPEEGGEIETLPTPTPEERPVVDPALPVTQDDDDGEGGESEPRTASSEVTSVGGSVLRLVPLRGLEQTVPRRCNNRIILVRANGVEEELMREEGWRLQLYTPYDVQHIRFAQVMMTTMRKTEAMLTGLQGVKTVIDDWHLWPERYMPEIWHGDTYFYEAREGLRGTQFRMSLHNRLYLQWEPHVDGDRHDTVVHDRGVQHDHSDVPTLPPPGRAVPRYEPNAESPEQEGAEEEEAPEETPMAVETEEQLHPEGGEEETPFEEEMPLAASGSGADPFPDQQEDQNLVDENNEGGAKVLAATAVKKVFKHVNTHGTVCEFFNIAEEDDVNSAEGFRSDVQSQVESQLLVKSQVQSEARSRTWQIFACSRRATRIVPVSRSQKSLMPVAKSLSNAARDFFRRLRPSHGVQEDHDGAEGLRHAAERGRGEAHGRSVTFGGSQVVGDSELEEVDNGGNASHQHYKAADGVGLHAEEGPGHGRGEVQRSGHQEQDEVEEGQECLDRSRNWSTPEPVDGTEVLGEGAEGVQPSRRVPTLLGQSLQSVVGLSDMREPLGEVAAGQSGVLDQHSGSRDTRCTPSTSQNRNLSGTLAAPRSKPDQGNIQLAVDKRGRVSNVPTKETSSTGTTGYPKEHLTGARARSTSKDRQPEGLRALSRPKRTTVTEQTEIQELVQEESSWGHLTEMEDPNNPNLQQIEDSDF